MAGASMNGAQSAAAKKRAAKRAAKKARQKELRKQTIAAERERQKAMAETQAKREEEKRILEERRAKARADFQIAKQAAAAQGLPAPAMAKVEKPSAKADEPEYEAEAMKFRDQRYKMFADVFEKFNSRDAVGYMQRELSAAEQEALNIEPKDVLDVKDDDGPEEEKKLSKRKQKALTRLSIAELKQLVNRPDVVEQHDPNSHDPGLLCFLKAYRNTVPIPKHWCQKRKYLQGKRGFEKPRFDLPNFIKDTGISSIRDMQNASGDGKSMKQRAKERVQPKLGRIDIDYQVLHDAFFRFQTKPRLSKFGEMYYEGKEFELKLVDKKAGALSEELMDALGMVNHERSPPPWLYNMQRFGPPPSYPRMKIAGVNCPIPAGCKYGFGDGEWGKPPVNEFGQSIWGGNVFGAAETTTEAVVTVDDTAWGQIDEEEEEDDEEEEMGEEEEDVGEDMEMEAGVEDTQPGTQSTISSVGGLETPDVITLRKDGTGTETPGTVAAGGPSTSAPRQLYQVLEEKSLSAERNAMFPSARTYVLPTGQSAVPETAEEKMAREREKRKAQVRGQVAVALAPEDLENLDADTLKRKYQQQLASDRAQRVSNRADVEEVIEEESRKRRKVTKEKKFKF